MELAATRDDFSKENLPLEPYLRLSGWELWKVQNYLFIVCMTANGAILTLFLFFGHSLIDIVEGLINFITFFVLLLDLASVALLSTAFFIEHDTNGTDRIRPIILRLLIFTGYAWVILSLCWRIPLLLKGPYASIFLNKCDIGDIGGTFTNLFADTSIIIVFIISSFFLAGFLFLNDILRHLTREQDRKVFLVGMNTFFGVSNLGINLLLVYLLVIQGGSNLIGESVSVIAVKAIIIPIFGISASIDNSNTIKKTSLPQQEPFYLSKIKVKVARAIIFIINLYKAKKTRVYTIIAILILLLLPFSPFFAGNLFKARHCIEDFTIIRTAKTAEAKNMLLYLEALDKPADISCDNLFYMNNATLNQLSRRISDGISIHGDHRINDVSFRWEVTLEETSESLLTLNVFEKYAGDIDYTDCFLWWSDNIVHESKDFNEVSLPIKWVFIGTIHYTEPRGFVGITSTQIKQVIFLNANHEFVCFSYEFSRNVT